MDSSAEMGALSLSSQNHGLHRGLADEKLAHHLSELANSRLSSPLKQLYPYFGIPGMLMLAGGLPSPSYFPFESVSAEVLVVNQFKTVATPSTLGWLMASIFGNSRPKTTTIKVLKHEPNPTADTIQLSTALQYAQATGLVPLQGFIHKFVAEMHRPGYSNFDTLLCAGSTDAWAKIVTTLCESGDGILCENFTYPSALAAAWPSGIKPVPLAMDGGGMTPEGLEDVLSNWDVEERGGMRRPTVLYTVPVCQNPTGATMTAERKQAIYAICVKYDVIIVEDDPYFFLQAGEYSLPSTRAATAIPSRLGNATESDEDFVASLIPSFVRYDYQGRVLRIETFSKTICPGSRLGHITGHPYFLERILRANESSTQAPSGFSQALIAKLLVEEWGMKGFYRWLKGLKREYRDRRDTLVDCLLEYTHAQLEARESQGSIQLCTEEGKTLLSFVPPQGGMFVWLRVHVSNHPSFPARSASSLVMALWIALANKKVLLAPGTIFDARTFGQTEESFFNSFSEKELRIEEDDGYFRLSFSSATAEEMKLATLILHQVTKDFFAHI